MHPALAHRFLWMQKRWAELYPGLPKPKLSQTYRNKADQERMLAEGKSKTPWGVPCTTSGPLWPSTCGWTTTAPPAGTPPLFQKWGELAESLGLEWGGRWAQLVDGPHCQVPMPPSTYHLTGEALQAEAERRVRLLPPLPDPELEYEHPALPVEALHLMRGEGEIVLSVERARVVGQKLYVRIR